MNKKSVFALCLSLFAIAMLVKAGMPMQAGAQPGDANDPLVTRRYVDNRINELSAQIARLEAMISGGQIAPGAPPDGQLPPAMGAGAEVMLFRIYYVPQGQRIYFEGGAEFLLRTGDVSAVTGANGFIDITAGRDVTNGETIYHNHLLLVPVTDGRGVQFHTSGWIMIKGGYRVAS